MVIFAVIFIYLSLLHRTAETARRMYLVKNLKLVHLKPVRIVTLKSQETECLGECIDEEKCQSFNVCQINKELLCYLFAEQDGKYNGSRSCSYFSTKKVVVKTGPLLNHFKIKLLSQCVKSDTNHVLIIESSATGSSCAIFYLTNNNYLKLRDSDGCYKVTNKYSIVYDDDNYRCSEFIIQKLSTTVQSSFQIRLLPNETLCLNIHDATTYPRMIPCQYWPYYSLEFTT